MRKTLTLIATLALLFSVLATITSPGEDIKIDLRRLEGDWEGVGEFVMPVTDISMELSGRAHFAYDTAGGYLRTALIGEKYFFTYADTGHLWTNDETDSIYWEIWNNLGRHAKYQGIVQGNTISGLHRRSEGIYRVTIELVTNDSIDFKLTMTEPDGDRIDKAVFNLWRVKP